MRCPGCGTLLAPSVGPPDSAPWVCADCRRSFWGAELTPEACQAWRPERRDFGYDGRIADAARAQHAAAVDRGHNIGPDELPHLSVEQRAQVTRLEER